MNEDDRIQRYLSARADSINLPPLELGTIVERSQHRHRRRRATVGIAAAVVVLGASVALVANRGEDPDKVQVFSGPNVVPSNLDWTVVDQEAGLGLGWASSMAATADGATYSLSTSPGIGDPTTCCLQEPASLYRSSDGAAWEQVGLPPDLWATGLSSKGDRLYAVGTSPDGGGRKVVISSSDDGGANWDNVDLPFDLAGLDAKYPEQLSVMGPSIAAGPAGAVAAVSVSMYPDIPALLAAIGVSDEQGNYGLSADGTGVDVYAPDECVPPSTKPDSSGAFGDFSDFSDFSVFSDLSDFGSSDVREVPPLPPECFRTEDRAQEVTAHYSWEQLQVSAEQQSLIRGEVHVFAATDGEPFEPVILPAGTSGSSASVVADAAGYHLIMNPSGPTPTGASVLRSSDGVTWEADPVTLAGWTNGAGVVDGRAAFVVGGPDGRTVLHVSDGAGGWSSLDLTDAAGIDLTDFMYYGSGAVAFGPLGVAAVLADGDGGDGPAHTYLVHSADGVSLSVVELDPLLDEKTVAWPSTVTVTADAITASFTKPTKMPPTETPAQILVVGTPR